MAEIVDLGHNYKQHPVSVGHSEENNQIRQNDTSWLKEFLKYWTNFLFKSSYEYFDSGWRRWPAALMDAKHYVAIPVCK